MFDTHSHICYGVDDGSAEQEISQNMLFLAASNGTKAIFATPHVLDLKNRPAWETVKEQVEVLQRFTNEQDLGIAVYSGAEVFMNWELLPELGVEGSYCYNGGPYILVELPMEQLPNYAEEFWYELRLKGLYPVLAHPERYMYFIHNPELMLKWRREGMLFQCNIGSFAGQFGPHAKHNAELLAKHRLVDLVGSDGHRVQGRDTNMTRGLVELEAVIQDKMLLENILVKNPQKLVSGEEIAIHIPKEIIFREKKKSFWQRIFG